MHHRVEELADRPEGYRRPDAKPYYKIIPLSELISNVFGKGISTKGTWDAYNSIIKLGAENDVLLNTPFEKLATVTTEKMARAIIANREGRINIKPGYDGVYGAPLFSEDEREYTGLQKLPAYPAAAPKPQKKTKDDSAQKGLKNF